MSRLADGLRLTAKQTMQEYNAGSYADAVQFKTFMLSAVAQKELVWYPEHSVGNL